MIRNLMLPITETAGDDTAFAAAVSLASDLGAHLTAVLPVQLPMPATVWGLTLAMDVGGIHESLRQAAQAEAAKLRARPGQAGISCEVVVAETFGDAAASTIPWARCSDLNVLPSAVGEAASLVRHFFAVLLFESGRPVLALPPRSPVRFPIRHAVIAWRSTLEATRALHDALPLLQPGASVDVVTVEGDEVRNEEVAAADADIATHLARHGFKVNVVACPREDRSVAAALLQHAAESNAQLLVAGGYGHSRLREWALGGTTRELLEQSRIPVLFSH